MSGFEMEFFLHETKQWNYIENPVLGNNFNNN